MVIVQFMIMHLMINSGHSFSPNTHQDSRILIHINDSFVSAKNVCPRCANWLSNSSRAFWIRTRFSGIIPRQRPRYDSEIPPHSSIWVPQHAIISQNYSIQFLINLFGRSSFWLFQFHHKTCSIHQPARIILYLRIPTGQEILSRKQTNIISSSAFGYGTHNIEFEYKQWKIVNPADKI